MIDEFPRHIELCFSLVGLDFTVVITICLQMYAYFCMHGIGSWLEDQGEKILQIVYSITKVRYMNKLT
jgi:hypothetical protein